MKKILVLLVFISVIFYNCRKNVYEPTVTDIGQSFFPVKKGQIFIYKADSFKIGYQGLPINGIWKSFYIKEEVIYKSADTNRIVYTFARYHSKDSVKWNFVKYHFYEVEKFRVIHKEDDLLTTELVFPVSLHYYWNGNEFNNLDFQEYEYSILGYDFKSFDRIFPNSLKVRMDSTINSVQNHTRFSVFSKNIGIIYHESTYLDVPANDTIGTRFLKSLIKFSL
ncbi:MAG: hypothetical protein HUU47_04790 [Bacteroidetes bacterium]|nr:hypothetical protein [Bacteroidota bacterium]